MKVGAESNINFEPYLYLLPHHSTIASNLLSQPEAPHIILSL